MTDLNGITICYIKYIQIQRASLYTYTLYNYLFVNDSINYSSLIVLVKMMCNLAVLVFNLGHVMKDSKILK